MRLRHLANLVAKDWRENPWYERGEEAMDHQWAEFIWPAICEVDLSGVVVDLAAGHGRCSAKMLEVGVERLVIMDVNQENIEFCRDRFGDDPRISYRQNDGTVFNAEDGEFRFIFCWDSMVHFDSDVVRSYLQDTYRVLAPGGKAFYHHSNYTGDPAPYPLRAPGGRNFMSRDLFAHWAIRSGLTVVDQKVIDWSAPRLDCLTLLKK